MSIGGARSLVDFEMTADQLLVNFVWKWFVVLWSLVSNNLCSFHALFAAL
jgi:hypothetical protein